MSITTRWGGIKNRLHTRPTMVRDRRYKFVAAHGTNGGELYDLETDPHETHNLWEHPDCREIKIAMQERLIHRMGWTVDPLP